VTKGELLQVLRAEIDRVRSLPVEVGPSAAIVRAQRSGVMHRAGQSIDGGEAITDEAFAQQCLAELRAIA
jgi:hypothetical protein